MRHGLPAGLVKRNLTLPRREYAKLDFLRTSTEASSDSEVTRQALRHLEQLVEDEKHGIVLKAADRSGETELSSARFRDLPEATEELIRRSLILHKQSDERLKKLQVAMDVKDPSEVVRCALRFYEAIVRSAIAGARFFALLPSGEKLSVRFGSFVLSEETSEPSREPKPPDPDWSGGFSPETTPALRAAAARGR